MHRIDETCIIDTVTSIRSRCEDMLVLVEKVFIFFSSSEFRTRTD